MENFYNGNDTLNQNYINMQNNQGFYSGETYVLPNNNDMYNEKNMNNTSNYPYDNSFNNENEIFYNNDINYKRKLIEFKNVVKEYKDYFSNPNHSLSKIEEQGLCAELLELARMIEVKGENALLNWADKYGMNYVVIYAGKSTSECIATEIKARLSCYFAEIPVPDITVRIWETPASFAEA